MTNSEARKRAQAAASRLPRAEWWRRDSDGAYSHVAIQSDGTVIVSYDLMVEFLTDMGYAHDDQPRAEAQAAASQVQGAAEVGADEVERLATVIHEAECVAYNHEGRNARCEREARAIINAGWVSPERVAEARAEGMSDVDRGLFGTWRGYAEHLETLGSPECIAEAERQERLRIARAIRTTPWERVYPNPRPVPPDDQAAWIRGVDDGVEFTAAIAERGDS